MTLQVRAHYDGKFIVPDEPLEVPVNQPLTIQITVDHARQSTPSEADAAFQRLLRRAVPDTNIPDETLDAEELYGEE